MEEADFGEASYLMALDLQRWDSGPKLELPTTDAYPSVQRMPDADRDLRRMNQSTLEGGHLAYGTRPPSEPPSEPPSPAFARLRPPPQLSAYTRAVSSACMQVRVGRRRRGLADGRRSRRAAGRDAAAHGDPLRGGCESLRA